MTSRLTLRDRAASYAAAFPGRPPLQVVQEKGDDVLYGVWMGGQDYKNRSEFYGSYPPRYLDRVLALFPDVMSTATSDEVLHVFSGSLPPGPYVRCDIRQPADLPCSVYDLPGVCARVFNRALTFRLVLADPPYSAADAEKYETGMVDRRRAMAALAQVTRAGGFLVWLDCVWPIHRSKEWSTVGRITFIRSTNHRIRLVSIFERTAS